MEAEATHATGKSRVKYYKKTSPPSETTREYELYNVFGKLRVLEHEANTQSKR